MKDFKQDYKRYNSTVKTVQGACIWAKLKDFKVGV
jgi:hypothetical protein